MIPVAYFSERTNQAKMTKKILFQIFLCSLGVTGNQVLYYIGLEKSTPTIACALFNVIPALTFFLAVVLRQELVSIKHVSGQAKLAGTVICIAGAMVLSLYHGPLVNVGESNIHWKYIEQSGSSSSSANSSSILGPMCILLSAVSWAICLTVQAKVIEKYPAPYTSTFIMSAMATIQCATIGLGVNHKLSQWSLRDPDRLIASLCTAAGSTITTCLTSWSIQKKGALYVSVFNPLLLVIITVLSWALLHEKIFTGILIGSVLVVGGLYAVLWGKDKEMKLRLNEQINNPLLVQNV
ncbi:nodulin MtN21 /EamA-like transporter family protein [Euphorbia peplus]|nr:nodulin MtN21 /EamA-like transporter family protein [Euphorbia peplus]